VPHVDYHNPRDSFSLPIFFSNSLPVPSMILLSIVVLFVEPVLCTLEAHFTGKAR